jgi:hypothetical protein
MPIMVSFSLSLGGSFSGSSIGIQKERFEKIPSFRIFFFARFLTSLNIGNRDYLSGDFCRTGIATLRTLMCSLRSILEVRFIYVASIRVIVYKSSNRLD